MTDAEQLCNACLSLSVHSVICISNRNIKQTIKERAEISHGTAATQVQMLIDVKFLYIRIVENIMLKTFWEKNLYVHTVHNENKKNHKVKERKSAK